jgi:hypothetical protein
MVTRNRFQPLSNDEKGDDAVDPPTMINNIQCFSAKTNEASDIFIIDTGCIGSHILKSTTLVRNCSKVSQAAVRDFSGKGHIPLCKGNLLDSS